MSPELTTILMLLSLLILLTGFPIALGVGTVGLVFGLLTSGQAFLYMMPMRLMTGTLSEYILAAVPLFIFMGTMMQTSGVAERAFQVLHKWMSGLNGGLAVATVALAILFAATTGVVGASETAIGLLAVPAMLNANYKQSLASGCVCAGGTLGILIPPSIMLILYAPMAGVSVIQMFAGAMIPGILLGYLYRLYPDPVFYHSGIAKPAPGRRCRFFPWNLSSWGSNISFLRPSRGSRSGLHSYRGCFPHGGRGRRFHRRHHPEYVVQAAYLEEIQGKLFYDDQDYVDDYFHRRCRQPFYRRFSERGVRSGDYRFSHVPWFRQVGHLYYHAADYPFLGMFIDWIGILLIVVPIFSPILFNLGFDALWVGLVICTSLQYRSFHRRSPTPFFT